jgi:drug/metabolite transporter (DMT)-like permease
VTRGSRLSKKTAVFLSIAVISNSFGNLLLALAMNRLPDFFSTHLPHYLYLVAVNPFLIPGTVLSAIYMLAQLSLFSWADLSFVVPVIASSYVVTTLLSEFVLGEAVDWQRWGGVTLISAGVALVVSTRPATRPAQESERRC